MAVVNNKFMQEEQQRINNQKANRGTTGYNYSPVSAEKKASTPKVTQQAAQYTLGIAPSTYVSRYQPAMDAILEQIQNPDQFKYEFNGDELFKNYADLYTQHAKQGMLDAMGQVAGLTGGYGNSYGQQVGQQTYQQNLLPLYDKGMELRNAAYQGYQDELANLKDTYSMMQAAEDADYQKYLDAIDWAYKMDQFKYQWGLNQPAEEEAGGGGGGYYPTGSNEEPKLTGTTFQDATKAVQTNTLKNNQNLPASTLNSKLTGTVADYVKAAQNKLASMPATLQAAIKGTKTTNNKTLSKTTPAVSKNKFGK